MTMFRKMTVIGLSFALLLQVAAVASAKEEEIEYDPLRKEYLEPLHAP